MLQAAMVKNDSKAKILIWTVSVVVFVVVAILAKFKLNFNPGFNVHLFATFNAFNNFIVAILLLAGLVAISLNKYLLHKKVMLSAIILSVFFLVSYICHHLLAGETKFGDLNHDGILSAGELETAGNLRTLYYALLITHIPLAAIVLPFILYTAYYSLTGEYEKHKKLARITWPLWFYVAVTGVIVYVMISPYYS